MPSKQPNIVLLITDAQRFDAVGTYPGTACRTPTFDRVAAEGAGFTSLRCTSPICSPARASLFTGYQPHEAGMPHLPSATPATDKSSPTADMAINKVTFPEMCRRAGYKAYLAGKWHVGEVTVSDAFDVYAGNDAYGNDYGDWCKARGLPEGRLFNRTGRNPYRSTRPPGMSLPRPGVLDMPPGTDWDAWSVGHAIRFLEEMDVSRPFLLTVCTRGPHSPFVVPPEYFDMYDPNAIPEPPNFQPSPSEPEFLENSYYRKMWREYGEDWEKWRKSVAVYWGYATYLDSLMGRVIERLKKRGVYDETLLIMTADHGEMLGQHGLAHKMCPYDENLRVPLAMRWPGVIRAGTRISTDVSQIDIAPTVLAAAGIPPDPAWEGENLLEYASGRKRAPSSRDVFTQYNLGPDWDFHEVHNWRLVVRRPWKYIFHESYGPEMYNLEKDPWEVNNLGSDPETAQVRAKMHRVLVDWMSRTGDPMLTRMEAAQVS